MKATERILPACPENCSGLGEPALRSSGTFTEASQAPNATQRWSRLKLDSITVAPNGTSAASFGSGSVRGSHSLPFASGAKLAVAAHLASELSAIAQGSAAPRSHNSALTPNSFSEHMAVAHARRREESEPPPG